MSESKVPGLQVRLRGSPLVGALPWVGVALSAAAFGLDLMLPLGAALGPCYVLSVFTTYGRPFCTATLGMAILVSAMVVVAMVAGNSLAVPASVVILNRVVALAAIWASVLLLYRSGLLRERLGRLEIEAEGRRRWLAQTTASISDGVVACDARARIEFMNSVAERLTGWNERDAAGRHINEVFDLVDEETGAAAHNPVLTALQGASSTLSQPTLLRSRDGRHWPIDDSAAPIRNDHGEIIGAVVIFRDISERRKSELQLELRLREVGHRIKNVFANVHAILSLCSRSANTPHELVTCVQTRLSSLVRSTDRLLLADGDGCSLRDIVIDEVEPYLEQRADRLHFSGTDAMFVSHASVSIAMIIHELATNASKYGSLSKPAGRVAVQCTSTGKNTIVLTWTETGGGAASPPERTGLGSKLIDGLVHSQFSGRCERSYTESGFTCRLELTVPEQA